MKCVIAIDSFKGSMSSVQAGNAAAEGIKRSLAEAETVVLPVADGGEGTVEALVLGLGGEIREIEVSNPLSRKIKSYYGIVGKTAVIEMAAAAGIFLIGKDELNPMHTTTFGVGEMIKDAISLGCRDFIIGIGGSATNDCGTGMLTALGFEFLDKDKKAIPFGGKALGSVCYINDENVIPQLKECTFNIACDVTNPLYGEKGCSKIYAKQKGASDNEIEFMDKEIMAFSKVVKEKYSDSDPDFPGSGAAGGLGYAFRTFLGGNLQSGIDLILDKIGIEEHIKDADLVITGEGKIDSQTVMGKAPIGISKIAKIYNKPVIAFAGCVTRDAYVCNEHGIDAIFSITPSACTLEEAMDVENAMKNMTDAADQAFRLWNM